MTPHQRTLHWLVWGLLIAVIVAISAAFVWNRLNPPLTLPKLWPVGDFTLTNQLGQPVQLADLRGKIWVADIIFTRCPGPCAQMTKRMKELQNALPAQAPVKLVSITSDPEFDTPSVLQKYARHYGADTNRWIFLTGPKAEIRRLAVEGLKLVLVDKKPEERTIPEDLFIHSTLFVAVDKAGHARASVESLEAPALKQLKDAVRSLRREK
jgi:protein SCO1/2